MRKLILLSTALLLTLSLTSVYAKNDNVKTNNSKANRNVQNLEDADQDPDEVGGVEESTTSQSPSEAAKSRNAIRKLEQIKVTATTPEMEEEIDEVVEEQEEVQDTVDDAIVEVDQRPSFVKFLIGPDFKNLGQLRKEVVQTRNNIRKLERVREKVTEEEQTAIDEAITELETNALNLQASIGEKLEGFSLFGWLFRWLSDFDAPEEPDVSPTPSAEPTASPEVSASPTATPSASLSPTASPAEEETPSSTGIAD